MVADSLTYQRRREEMVNRQIAGRGVTDARVLAAMAKVPRHRFVSEALADQAYSDYPLPIGEQQTISQPFIVAEMSQALALSADDRVLEIGTGSGYQAAVLAEIAYRVYTVERIHALLLQARRRFDELRYHNIVTHYSDGTTGWKEQAPFDAIIVTAAASHIPPPLIRQLRPGGHMIIPVGSRFMVQQLVLVDKDEDSEVTTRQVLPVHFVPLTGDH